MRILTILLLTVLAGCGQQAGYESKNARGAAPDKGESESDDARPKKKKKPVKTSLPARPAEGAAATDGGAPASAPGPTTPAALPESTLAWDGETITGTPTLNLLPTE